MSFDLKTLISQHQGKQFSLNEKYVNPQLVKLLKTIGFNRNFIKAQGPYIFDGNGEKYLDCLSGYGVFAFGRNHPLIAQTIKSVLDAELPNMVQMDTPLLAGLLAEKLVALAPPSLERVFFCNSGAEAVEGAIKFAKAATGRSKILYCHQSFHGLTNGALSLNGCEAFREGFEPLLEGCEAVPFNDLGALEKALAGKKTAAFFVEPVQGKSIQVAASGYLPEAQRLCRKYGSLLVVDEVQTGFGRTGKFFAFEHWGIEPDLVTVAKALSGGAVPVGALLGRKEIFEKVYSRLDRAVIHSSTFGRNNLAMAAGLASLHIIQEEKLAEQAASKGTFLKEAFEKFIGKYEFVKAVRGKGMMLGIEFGPPKSLTLKTAWKLLEKTNKGLFCQMIAIPLFKDHRILTQVSGHGSYVVKLLPPLNLSEEDLRWIVDGFEKTIAAAHRFPGAVWDLAKSLAGNALNKESSQEKRSSA